MMIQTEMCSFPGCAVEAEGRVYMNEATWELVLLTGPPGVWGPVSSPVCAGHAALVVRVLLGMQAGKPFEDAIRGVKKAEQGRLI